MEGYFITSEKNVEKAEKKFVNFLKKCDAYSKFLKNLSRNKKYDAYSYPKMASPFYYLISAFNWNETEEGVYFWLGLHKEWSKILNKLWYSLTK